MWNRINVPSADKLTVLVNVQESGEQAAVWQDFWTQLFRAFVVVNVNVLVSDVAVLSAAIAVLVVNVAVLVLNVTNAVVAAAIVM